MGRPGRASPFAGLASAVSCATCSGSRMTPNMLGLAPFSWCCLRASQRARGFMDFIIIYMYPGFSPPSPSGRRCAAKPFASRCVSRCKEFRLIFSGSEPCVQRLEVHGGAAEAAKKITLVYCIHAAWRLVSTPAACRAVQCLALLTIYTVSEKILFKKGMVANFSKLKKTGR